VKKLLLLGLLAFSFGICSAQVHFDLGWQNFTKPLPRLDEDTRLLKLQRNVQITMSGWRPMATIPLFRLQDGNLVPVTVGGGIAWQYLKYNDSTQRWNVLVSLSPATILAGVNNGFSFSYAATAGFYNNFIVIGAGWDFTKNEPFYLIGVNINFNN
jgi:hypothetical protein